MFEIRNIRLKNILRQCHVKHFFVLTTKIIFQCGSYENKSMLRLHYKYAVQLTLGLTQLLQHSTECFFGIGSLCCSATDPVLSN